VIKTKTTGFAGHVASMGENSHRGDQFEDLYVDGRIILKRILNE
jgi:hypothetical protein